MALIIMAVFDTEENGRSEYTERTLESLRKTVDWARHRLVVVDNGSCERTKNLLLHLPMYGFYGYIPNCKIITNDENLGTAGAVNQGLRLRNTGEYCVKVDNDVVVHSDGWVDELEEAIKRDPTIGVLGLKRKDLIQTQWHEDPNFRSEGVMLPHEPGQRWIWVERTNDVMGTCTMYNWRLIDKIGGLAQPTKYSFDDTLYNLRTHLAGFTTCFLPHINIDHIDTGANPYTQEKHRLAGEIWNTYHQWHEQYISGERPLYEEI